MLKIAPFIIETDSMSVKYTRSSVPTCWMEQSREQDHLFQERGGEWMESQQLIKDNQLLEREDISMSPSEQTLVETDIIPDGTPEKGCVSQIIYMDLAGPLLTTQDDYNRTNALGPIG